MLRRKTILAVLPEYLVYLESDMAATEATLKHRKWYITSLHTYFKVPLVKISPEMVRNYLLEQRRRVKPLTVASYHRLARALFNWCVMAGYLKVSPMKGMKLKLPPKTMRPAMPLKELRSRLLAACEDDRERLVVMLLTYTGMRSIEITRAKWEHINEDATLLEVHGKGNKVRFVPLKDELRDALLARRECQRLMQEVKIKTGWTLNADIDGESPYLIENFRAKRTGRPGLKSSTLCKLVSEIAIRAGLDGPLKQRAHDCRRSVATNLIRKTGDLESVREWLGHADVATTVLYTKCSPERLKEMAVALD